MFAILWSDEQAERAASWTMARFVAFGLAVSQSSRLPRALGTVTRSRAKSLVDLRTQGDLSERVLEAHRTIMEFYCIAHTLAGPDDSMIPVVRKALAGPDTVREDRKGAARNFQFEALIAALIRLAGIAGVSEAEPDIRIATGDTFLGIAAKRITSLDQHQREKNIQKAILQIERQEVPGIIVLNLDSLADHAMQRGGRAEADRTLQTTVVEASNLVERRCPAGRVGGVFGFATLLGWNTAVWPATLSLYVYSHAHIVAHEELRESARTFLSQRGARLTESLQQLFN